MTTNANPDLTFKLPKQLQDQIKAADSIRSDMNGTAAPQEGPPDAIQPSAGTPQPPATENAPAAPYVPEEDQTWEQKFKSLQGRHDQAQRNAQSLSQRIADLEDLIETMKATNDGRMPETHGTATYQKLLTPEEETDYGQEMLTVVAKKAREELTPEVETLKQRLDRLEGRVDGVGNVMARTSQEKMYDGLNAQIPNWQQINVDQGFKDWLQTNDPYSGRQRHGMLMEAFTRHDTQRVVQFFKGYAEVTGIPTTPESPGNVAPPPNSGSGRPSLADFAAPGRARSGQDIVSPDKPIYTNAQIARFYADMRVGKWRGREADAQAIERDIYEAQREGRIQQ